MAEMKDLPTLKGVHVEEFHLMENRLHRETFVQLTESDPTVLHELVFAIQQSNLDKLETIVLERSTPGNALYQQWVTYDDVGELTANPIAYDAVYNWLATNEVTVKWTSPRKEYIKAKAPISVWNRLLSTTFYQFEDTALPMGKNSKKRLAHRANEYSLPKSLQPHLMTVFNTVQNPPVLNPRAYERAPYKSSFRSDISVQKVPGAEHRPVKEVQANGKVTVQFLNDFYRITTNTGSATQSQAVFQTNEESFSPTDLSLFQSTYGLPQQSPEDPSNMATADCINNSCYEGNLDLQYIMGVSQQTASIFWYVDPNAQNNPFLEWIEQVVADPNPPLVNSISWGAPEQSCAASDLQQFNTEAMKLAALGVTIVVSSGDNGAAGRVQNCNANSGSLVSPLWVGAPWTGVGYFPSFPASAPYVTAVGATQGPESDDPEIACQSQEGGVITTGGGFSTYYATPSWQSDAVNNYFNTLPSGTTPTSGYNRNGRGFPDISFVGVNYQTVIQGDLVGLYGTSASAPLLGAMLSLLNAARAESNITSVGFINPTLYAYGAENTFGPGGANFNPYNDVTEGNTKCMARNAQGQVYCCSSGFYATEGWDPVTGWGSAFYPDLAQMLSVEVNYTESPSSDGNDNKNGLSQTDSIVIGVVVGVVGLLLLVGIASCLCCGRKNESTSRPPAQAYAVASAPPA